MCPYNPCQNGGSCLINSLGEYYCSCSVYYTGIYCQSQLSNETTTTTKTATTVSPKTCVDYNSTLCQSYAAKGYCSLNLYVNGALISVSCAASCNPTCKTTTNIASTTSIHFISKNKLVSIKFISLKLAQISTLCLINPCLNGGSCYLTNGIPSCTCSTGYTGVYCGTEINCEYIFLSM